MDTTFTYRKLQYFYIQEIQKLLSFNSLAFRYIYVHFCDQNEGRGLRDPEGVKRNRQKQEAAEKIALKEGRTGDTGRKVIAKRAYLIFSSVFRGACPPPWNIRKHFLTRYTVKSGISKV